METTGIVPTMPLSGGSAYGNDSWIFLFAILALMWGGGGLFGNRYGQFDSRAATVEDLNNSANFTRLEGQVMNNGNRIEQKADAAYSGICKLGYEMAQQFGTSREQVANCCLKNFIGNRKRNLTLCA